MGTFRVWAPAARRVAVELTRTGPPAAEDPPGRHGRNPDRPEADRHDLHEGAGGWWSREVTDAGPGIDYAFRLDHGEGYGKALPDPRSRWQPRGVHGPSRTVDHLGYPWSDGDWRGVSLAGSVVYELHVGTFTPAGTFVAAAARLDHLVELGVDVVELMPVAAFDGSRGWGYDGVGLFAVHEPYGGPDGLKHFVQECHRRGLGVMLDVVYNHLGPAGNYLSAFGPYFTDTHLTPWGPAVNLDAAGSDEVRRYIIENATSWLRDYHLDGLRLDAVHALVDGRATHLLEELAGAVRRCSTELRRELFLVAESDGNDPRVVRPPEAGGYGVDAQWSDDFHHSLHAVLTGERAGYYRDFGSLATLGKALQRAFVHDGGWSSFRGRSHGRPPTGVAGHRFLGYLQNHDQVGNRAAGERSAALLSTGLLKVGAALVLTAPFTPMLFMGEEWGAATRWQFFTSFAEPALGDVVRSGRRREFADHDWAGREVPDPQDPATFERSRLDWSELTEPPHDELLDWHRRLIALRRARPEMADDRLDRIGCSWDEDARWFVLRRGALVVACNLAATRRSVPVPGAPAEVLLASAPGFVYGPGQVELDGESVLVLVLA